MAQAGTVGSYGTFAIGANGAWTYTASSAHNEFVAGQHYTDSFDVVSADGTHTSVNINILGTNDAAVLSSATVNLTETNAAADISTSGTLTISDVDSPATFVAQAGTVGSYGTFAIGTNGAWTYTASSAHNEFVAGTTYTESFDVVSADGTHTSVNIDILATVEPAAPVDQVIATEPATPVDQHRDHRAGHSGGPHRDRRAGHAGGSGHRDRAGRSGGSGHRDRRAGHAGGSGHRDHRAGRAGGSGHRDHSRPLRWTRSSRPSSRPLRWIRSSRPSSRPRKTPLLL